MRKVHLDTETTGLSPGNVAQLAMIIEEDTGELKAKNYFFDIDYLEPGAAEVCGRTLEFYKEVSQGKRFTDYKDEILQDLQDSAIVAHNVSFDENFICTEFWRAGITFKPVQIFDTMTNFKPIVKSLGRTGRIKNPKLEEVINFYTLDKLKIEKYVTQLFNMTTTDTTGLHDARYDATVVLILFQIYRDMLNNKTSWRDTFKKT